METHSELVEYAAKWLKAKYPIVITELAGVGREEADAIAFNGAHSILIECKISMADYHRDKSKWFRHYPDQGMGSERYYLTPEKLLNPDQLPEKWGLLEVRKGKVRRIKKPVGFLKKNESNEIRVIISVLKRIGQNPPKGVSIRCYTSETKNRAAIYFNNHTPDKEPKGDNEEKQEGTVPRSDYDKLKAENARLKELVKGAKNIFCTKYGIELSKRDHDTTCWIMKANKELGEDS